MGRPFNTAVVGRMLGVALNRAVQKGHYVARFASHYVLNLLSRRRAHCCLRVTACEYPGQHYKNYEKDCASRITFRLSTGVFGKTVILDFGTSIAWRIIAYAKHRERFRDRQWFLRSVVMIKN